MSDVSATEVNQEQEAFDKRRANTRAVKAADLAARQAKMKPILEKQADDYKKLSKNSIAYMATVDVARHTHVTSDDQKTELKQALSLIAKKHPMLLGLVVEDKNYLTRELGIREDTSGFINNFMKEHGIEMGGLRDRHIARELAETMEQPAEEAGTRRAANYRRAADKLLGNVAPDHKTLLPVKTPLNVKRGKGFINNLRALLAKQDIGGQLTVKFKIGAEFKEEIEGASLTNGAIEYAINGSVRREVRSLFAKASNISTPTDSPELIETYDSRDPTSVEIDLVKNEATVVVPLTGGVEWAFSNGVISDQQISGLSDALALAVIRGTRRAASLQNGEPEENTFDVTDYS